MRTIRLPEKRYKVEYDIATCEHCGGPTLKRRVMIVWPTVVGLCRNCGSYDVQESLESESVCECDPDVKIVEYKK